MNIQEKLDAAYREMVCARPVGAGDGNTYTVEPPTRERFRKAVLTATGLTEAQLEGLAAGTMTVVPIGSPVGLVISERARQVSKGYNARHDDMHDDGSIISADWGAAKRLAMATDHYAQMDDPMTYVKRLVQAAAMIFSELDRVDRAMLAAKEG